MNLARKAVIVGQYADHDVTIRVRRSGTPRSGFVQRLEEEEPDSKDRLHL